jgi:NADH-ubiquinone oxidoreductase chain 2
LLISLGGLPPFLGFIPKWLVLTNLISNNLFLLRIILVISSLITLFFYLRIIFPAMLMNRKVSLKFKFYQKPIIYFAAFNFLGLSIIPYVLLA